MPATTITAKGQLTVPRQVRADMGLAAGDRVEFIRMEDGYYAMVPVSHSVKMLKGIIPKPQGPVTLEDMQRAIEIAAGGE